LLFPHESLSFPSLTGELGIIELVPGNSLKHDKRVSSGADIYMKSGKGLEASINFVTSHDGFTLNDLVSYRSKHNEANGENNHDGTDYNLSENYGTDGPTEDARGELICRNQVE
jgi:isoamylase